MKNELKPCPFCGSTKLKLAKKKIKYKGRNAYVASVRCNCCNARGGTVTNLTVPYAAKEDVEQLATDKWNNRADQSKWIPCSERLPDESGEYITYCGAYDGIKIVGFKRLKTTVGWLTRYSTVIAWQPLPEPYVEVHDGN